MIVTYSDFGFSETSENCKILHSLTYKNKLLKLLNVNLNTAKFINGRIKVLFDRLTVMSHWVLQI